MRPTNDDLQKTGTPVGADYSFSKNKTEYRRGHSIVMLSRSEASRGPTRQTLRCGSG